MIAVRCRTNLDNYKREVWPTEMACRPAVGDRVRAESGNSLCVVGITHTMELPYRSIEANELLKTVPKPILIIELHKRGG